MVVVLFRLFGVWVGLFWGCVSLIGCCFGCLLLGWVFGWWVWLVVGDLFVCCGLVICLFVAVYLLFGWLVIVCFAVFLGGVGFGCFVLSWVCFVWSLL